MNENTLGLRIRHYCRRRALFCGLVILGMSACASTEVYHPETGTLLYRSTKDQVWHVEHCREWSEDVCFGRTVVDVGASTPELQVVTEAIKRIPTPP